jgi:ABC-type multidrug transport system fused ATPase/permease subunit
MRRADPAGLGRGPLTRWLPVLGQAPAKPPEVRPFEAKAGERPGRFVARVVFSLPGLTIPALLLALVWQVGESAVPLVMGLAIDRALATGDARQFALWLGVLAALYAALTAAARLTSRLGAYAIQLLQHRLRGTLSVQMLHPAGAARAPGGEVVSVMTNDVARLSNAVLLLVIPVARIGAIGFIAASLLAMCWPLGVVVLLGAPLAVWLTALLSERLARDTRTYQDLLASTVGRATDLVAGHRVIKGVRAEAEATMRYRRASQQALVGARRNAGLRGRFLMGSGAINGVFVAGVTGLAGWLAVGGRLSVGELIAAVALTQALLPQMQSITSYSVPNLADARASAARILDALGGARATPIGRDDDAPAGGPPPPQLPVPGAAQTTPAGLDDAAPARGTPPPHLAVPAPGATQATPAGLDDAAPTGGTPPPHLAVSVLGASIQVEPGELVGVRADDRIAARIVEALLNPHAAGAEVLLDGRDARELAPAHYRSRVTVAPHRATLFTGTIRDNLTAARGPELNDNALTAALRAAACEDFAADLTAPVGENGNRLSGGQRQRVALARALATDAPVLVLHDPTTAVDSATEQTIARRLPGARQDRSTLLIASSPALLGRCDRVVDLVEETLLDCCDRVVDLADETLLDCCDRVVDLVDEAPPPTGTAAT